MSSEPRPRSRNCHGESLLKVIHLDNFFKDRLIYLISSGALAATWGTGAVLGKERIVKRIMLV